jgi:tetratricopeptide (TPR) repeat protein
LEIKEEYNLSEYKTYGQESQDNDDLLFTEACKQHELGVGGDKEAVKKSHDLFKKLYDKDNKNNLIAAYLGSATSLMGRDAIDPNQRLKLALKGLKMLDNAVKQEEENIEIRNLRANVCFRLPEMYFHRTGTAVEDFSYLASRYEQDNSVFDEERYWQVLLNLGSAYKELNQMQNAQSIWSKLAAVTNSSKYMMLLRQAGFDTTNIVKQPEQVEQDGKKQEVRALKGFVESLPESGKKKDEKDIDEGIWLHFCAHQQGGEFVDVQKALKAFEQFYGESPEDPVITAYYADCVSLMGIYAKDSTSMFSNAIKAMKIFDSAVNGSPDCIEARLLRGLQSFRLPEAFFKRTATAITDFEYLVDRYRQDSTIFSEELYWMILYLLGKAYQRLDMDSEAKAAWQSLLNKSSDDKYKALLEKELSENSEVSRLPDDLSKLSRTELFNEAVRLHNLAVEGNRKASQKALELMKKVYEEEPDDPLVEGYYGSSLALAGRDSNNSQELFNNAVQGLQHLKHAASKDSNNISLRLMRANLMYNLPDAFFPLVAKTCKEFKFIASSYERDNSVIPQESYWEVLYKLGMCYERSNNKEKALKTWKKLLKASQEAKYNELLKRKFEGSDDK